MQRSPSECRKPIGTLCRCTFIKYCLSRMKDRLRRRCHRRAAAAATASTTRDLSNAATPSWAGRDARRFAAKMTSSRPGQRGATDRPPAAWLALRPRNCSSPTSIRRTCLFFSAWPGARGRAPVSHLNWALTCFMSDELACRTLYGLAQRRHNSRGLCRGDASRAISTSPTQTDDVPPTHRTQTRRGFLRRRL